MQSSGSIVNYQAKLAGQYSGIFFLVIQFTLVPYLISISPGYELTFSRFTPLTHLGIDPVTASIFNALLIFQGLLMYLFFRYYFLKSRGLYRNLFGWKAIVRLVFLGSIGLVGVGLYPDLPNQHIPHIAAAALSFGAPTFAIIIISCNLLALSKADDLGIFRFQAIFGMFLMVLGMSFTSIFMFLNVNQGLWQTAQIVLVSVWFTLENLFYKRKRDILNNIDQHILREEGVIYLKYAVNMIFLFSLSLVILGIIGFIDMDILSKCNPDCKPNLDDYTVLLGFGLFLVIVLILIKRSNSKL